MNPADAGGVLLYPDPADISGVLDPAADAGGNDAEANGVAGREGMTGGEGRGRGGRFCGGGWV